MMSSHWCMVIDGWWLMVDGWWLVCSHLNWSVICLNPQIWVGRNRNLSPTTPSGFNIHSNSTLSILTHSRLDLTPIQSGSLYHVCILFVKETMVSHQILITIFFFFLLNIQFWAFWLIDFFLCVGSLYKIWILIQNLPGTQIDYLQSKMDFVWVTLLVNLCVSPWDLETSSTGLQRYLHLRLMFQESYTCFKLLYIYVLYSIYILLYSN